MAFEVKPDVGEMGGLVDVDTNGEGWMDRVGYQAAAAAV